MKKAELYVKKKLNRTHKVLGGFVSPCHPMYLSLKLGDDAIPHSTRNYLIHLALVDDPLWNVDSFMSSTDDFIQNEQVLSIFYTRLLKYGKGLNKTNFDVFWIVGTDNFGMIPEELFNKNFHLVVVENRDNKSLHQYKNIKQMLATMTQDHADRYHFVNAE